MSSSSTFAAVQLAGDTLMATSPDDEKTFDAKATGSLVRDLGVKFDSLKVEVRTGASDMQTWRKTMAQDLAGVKAKTEEIDAKLSSIDSHLAKILKSLGEKL